MPLHTPLGSLDLSLTHLCNEVPNSDLPELEHQVIKSGAGGERVLSDSKGRGLGDSGHTIIILYSPPHPLPPGHAQSLCFELGSDLG